MLPSAYILFVFLEGYLLNIFFREIQTVSKLDSSCRKLIYINNYFHSILMTSIVEPYCTTYCTNVKRKWVPAPNSEMTVAYPGHCWTRRSVVMSILCSNSDPKAKFKHKLACCSYWSVAQSMQDWANLTVVVTLKFPWARSVCLTS